MIHVQEHTAKDIAALLLDVKAIQLNLDKPFTWSSGWKSPIYCDNRLTLSYPETRKKITAALVEAVQTHFPQAQCIAGVATAGIPQGILVADALNLPFVYVRPKPKGHGMENLIEGKITKGQKVAVVEDLISTGGSSLKAIEALRLACFVVEGMVSIFNYGFPEADKNCDESQVKAISLSDYAHLLKAALELNYIREEEVISLKAWRTDPAHWKA